MTNQKNTSEKEIKTKMIIDDMNQAGFSARTNLNGDCQVSLIRPVSLMEIDNVMMQAGYDKSQYKLESVHNSVVITAL